MNDIYLNKNNNELHIKYFGNLYKNNSESISIKFGYTNNWNNINEKTMDRVENGFETTIYLLPNFDMINFCFYNERGEWDNNENKNFSVNLNKEINIDELKDNGLLLISEIQNKVFLPYTVKEVLDILERDDNEYSSTGEVIENEFVKSFNYYKYPFVSRFKETVKLITKRENMSLKDGIDLGTELCKKRYLHPAIISACKNLDELNVYLDCLDKNELDDFKVFDIKYEMLPMIINEEKALFVDKKLIVKLKSFIKKFFLKKDTTNDILNKT